MLFLAKRVNEEEIMKARDVDLLDFLQKNGEEFKKEGKYYRHKKHDSLLIRDNMYAWNSKGVKGYGALNFVQMYYGMDFVTAVQELNKEEYQVIDKSKKAPKEKREPFSYEKRKRMEVNHQRDITRYLVEERKIDPRIVKWLIQKDLIAQDQRKNVVFKWIKNGEVIGYNLQGTVKMNNKRGSYKHVAPNDDPDYGFTFDIGKPERLMCFEDGIDALSYWSIKKDQLKNVRIVSMNGLKEKTIANAYKQAVYKEGHKIKKIILGVDNDEGGKKFIDKMNTLVNPDILEADVPKHTKDWNDELKRQVKSKVQEKEEGLLNQIKEEHLAAKKKRQKSKREIDLDQAL